MLRRGGCRLEKTKNTERTISEGYTSVVANYNSIGGLGDPMLGHRVTLQQPTAAAAAIHLANRLL